MKVNGIAVALKSREEMPYVRSLMTAAIGSRTKAFVPALDGTFYAVASFPMASTALAIAGDLQNIEASIASSKRLAIGVAMGGRVPIPYRRCLNVHVNIGWLDSRTSWPVAAEWRRTLT